MIKHATVAIGWILISLTTPHTVRAQSPKASLLSDTTLDGWMCREDAWHKTPEGSITCRMEEVKNKKTGQVRKRSMGYLWSKNSFGDFELSLSYKLSAGCNSGIFFRADPKNPVQGGFEVQLLDDDGFRKVKGTLDKKNCNGAFYDCRAADKNPSRPIGEWNQLRLSVNGSHCELHINGIRCNAIDINEWDTAGMNPDGTENKFKTALKQLPRVGHIGFQNHGHPVWFKDISIRAIK